MAESALQRPRAAQRQPTRSNRAGQVGTTQVDAVERAGVNDDLEVDVETGMLEASPLANLIPVWNPLWLRRAERQINPPIDGYKARLLCFALHYALATFA